MSHVVEEDFRVGPKEVSATPQGASKMQRNLGDVRFPAAMLTIFSGIMFGVLCSMLHRRDERVAEARGLVPATVES